jgi:hypothetical protein
MCTGTREHMYKTAIPYASTCSRYAHASTSTTHAHTHTQAKVRYKTHIQDTRTRTGTRHTRAHVQDTRERRYIPRTGTREHMYKRTREGSNKTRSRIRTSQVLDTRTRACEHTYKTHVHAHESAGTRHTRAHVQECTDTRAHVQDTRTRTRGHT